MKVPVRRSALNAVTTCLVIASASLSVNTFGQEPSATAHMTRAAVRSANHRLERSVRKALDGAKLDTSDVRVVARDGKVSLDGTTPDARQIELASSVARGVQGVSSVNNMLSLETHGH
jgi:osmotically-inducible protein OsmY